VSYIWRAMPKTRRAIAVVLAGLTGALLVMGGCGQILGLGDLSSAPLDGGRDTGRNGRGDAAPDARNTHEGSVDGAHDSGRQDGESVDAGVDACTPADADAAPAVCGVVGGTPVHVDWSAADGGNGSMIHPFSSITQALDSLVGAPPPTVTIQVAAGTYTENDIVVPANVSLVGAGSGPTGTRFEGPATCGRDAGVACPAITLNPGAILCGFSITTASSPAPSEGSGILASSGPLAVTSARIANVVVSQTRHSGITAASSFVVGPGVTSTQSGVDGLVALSGTLQVISACGLPNHFDDNGGDGVVVVSGAALDFQGGTAIGNTTDGVVVNGSGGEVVISNLVAHGNLEGVVVGAGIGGAGSVPRTFTLRASDLSGNTDLGLYYDYGSESPGATDPLDIGTPISPGHNIFARSGAPPKSGVGIFLCHARGLSSQAVTGDTFAECAPSTGSFTSCASVPPNYVDVGFVPRADAGIADPVTSCN